MVQHDSFDHLCVLSSRLVRTAEEVRTELEGRRIFEAARREFVDNEGLELYLEEDENAAGALITSADDFTPELVFDAFTFDVISMGDVGYQVTYIGPEPTPEEGKVEDPDAVYCAVIVNNGGNPMGTVFRGASHEVYMKFYDGRMTNSYQSVEGAALTLLINVRKENASLGELRDATEAKAALSFLDLLQPPAPTRARPRGFSM